MNNLLFEETGVHCLVDGQFGSTGKGAFAAWLAEYTIRHSISEIFSGCIYSGGPNSGHTFYVGEEKVVLKQLPSFAVYLYLKGITIPVYLSAGAIIDPKILWEEANRYPKLPIYVHPNATVVTNEDKEFELTGSIAEVAGTRSGTGAALARKVLREPTAIAANSPEFLLKPPNVQFQYHRLKPERYAYFMEVSQGFSLGINSQFYPKVTSRECTVMQGLADARIPPKMLAQTFMAIRSFPIRVGNVDGHSSGEWYPDQKEVSWEHLKVEPELTTVTKRVRRVASFSIDQFFEACHANRPDLVLVSHMDYLDEAGQQQLSDTLYTARNQMEMDYLFLWGYGPKVGHIGQHLRPDQASLPV